MDVILKKEEKIVAEEMHDFVSGLSKEEIKLLDVFIQGFRHGYIKAKDDLIKH